MRARDERGFTLVELLVVMTIALGVLGATLTTFNNLYQAEHDNDERNDMAEIARNALDVQARQLRNLAKRLNNAPVIDTVGGYDLIFQTSDPSRTWVRYCLDTSTTPASASRGRLWQAELKLDVATVVSPVTAGMRSGCPGTGWTTRKVVADHVTNRRAGLDRPLFTYSCIGGVSTCAASASTYDQIVNVAAQALVDTDPVRGAPELRVATGVYLRNQNQKPTATFVTTPLASRTVLLNASGSVDAEGRTMNYYWFKGPLPAESAVNCASPIASGTAPDRTLWGGAYLGEGITLTHTFAAAAGAAGSTHNIGLVVCDPGDRFGTHGIPPQATVPVPIPS